MILSQYGIRAINRAIIAAGVRISNVISIFKVRVSNRTVNGVMVSQFI